MTFSLFKKWDGENERRKQSTSSSSSRSSQSTSSSKYSDHSDDGGPFSTSSTLVNAPTVHHRKYYSTYYDWSKDPKYGGLVPRHAQSSHRREWRSEQRELRRETRREQALETAKRERLKSDVEEKKRGFRREWEERQARKGDGRLGGYGGF